MRVCPVCEAPVVGLLCDSCGRAFPAPPGPALLVVPLPELELQPASPVALPIAPLSDLEPTRFAAAPAPPQGATSDAELERTRGPEAPDVPAGGLLELERGREPETPRTPLASGPLTCRYCHHVQAPGLLCERCGMRLPWRASDVPATDLPALVKCRRCGERNPPRGRCASCGALPATE